jgi:hypothetical protein
MVVDGLHRGRCTLRQSTEFSHPWCCARALLSLLRLSFLLCARSTGFLSRTGFGRIGLVANACACLDPRAAASRWLLLLLCVVCGAWCRSTWQVGLLAGCWLAGPVTKRCVLPRSLLSFDSDIGAHLVLVDWLTWPQPGSHRTSQQDAWSMHVKPGDAPANCTAAQRRICRTKGPKGVQ